MKNSRFQEFRGRLMERLERSREMSDEEIYEIIDGLLTEEDARLRLRLPQRGELRRELFNSVRRLDILQELVEDDSVT